MAVEQVKDAGELELGDPPFIYSPYPENIVQVREPETRGEKDVVQMINENWKPEDGINDLERLSKEMFDGYSGSFIRMILRNFYAPVDLVESKNENRTKTRATRERREFMEERERRTIEEEALSLEEEDTEENGDVMDGETWHKTFRMGLRVVLEGNISEEEALDAFENGLIEGQKLVEEMRK